LILKFKKKTVRIGVKNYVEPCKFQPILNFMPQPYYCCYVERLLHSSSQHSTNCSKFYVHYYLHALANKDATIDYCSRLIWSINNIFLIKIYRLFKYCDRYRNGFDQFWSPERFYDSRIRFFTFSMQAHLC
jgi:hypothetical protein